MYVPRQYAFSCSSHTQGGGYGDDLKLAVNSRYDEETTRLETYLNPPLRISRNAENIKVRLLNASIWNTSPNVTQRSGENKLFFTYYGKSGPAATYQPENYTITFPDGLYSLEEMQTTLSRLLLEQDLASDLIQLGGDMATARVTFATSSLTGPGGVGALGLLIIRNLAGSMRTILGLGSDPNLTVQVPFNQIVRAPFKAQFNRVNWFELHSTIAAPGLSVNGVTRNVLGKVYPDKAPNSMVVYNPSYPVVCDAALLRGTEISRIDSHWTSDDGFTFLPTYNPWEYTCEITWDEPASHY